MSGEERLDEAWSERGLTGCAPDALLHALRHHGVEVDLERLARAPGRAEALALAASWVGSARGTGPLASFLLLAVLELWRRADSRRPPFAPASAPGLPRAFRESFAATPLDARLTLAREIAADPRFDGEEALELGRLLRHALRDAGRGVELESVLATWEATAPHAYHAEPALLGWRVECALRYPGADVHRALLALASWRGHLVPLLKLAEWCLYRGHVHAALASLTAAWPGVRDSLRLFDWDVEDFAHRAVLTTLDAALSQEPALPEAPLRERLLPFGPLVSGWLERALAYRSGAWTWSGAPEAWAGLSAAQLQLEQQALVMAFERALREQWDWPLGRTQLLHPWLLGLLPEVLPHAHAGGGAPRPAALLLPPEWALEEWAAPGSDNRYRHPHAQAAVSTALLPWGHFLRQLGLIDAYEHAAWRVQVTRAFARLPERFSFADDLALGDEVRQALREG